METHGLASKALLLLDNAPCHPPAEQLCNEDKSIITLYMPPNVTPLIQPMDQNVIRITKLQYRNSLLKSLVCQNEELGSILRKLTLKDAILNLAVAWHKVEVDMIEKCWHAVLKDTCLYDEDDDNVPLSILQSRWRSENITETVDEVAMLCSVIAPNVSGLVIFMNYHKNIRFFYCRSNIPVPKFWNGTHMKSLILII